MKVEDYFNTLLFKIKNRTKKIIIKKNSIVKKSFLEGKNIVDKNTKITSSSVGYGTYFGVYNKLDQIKIGRYCSIASNLNIITGTHPLKSNVSTHPCFYSINHKDKNKVDLCYIKENKHSEDKMLNKKWNIVIGNDVWIGSDVKILQGIKIGSGAVIGAGALVTKDVEPYAIVGGIPAKLIRKRFVDEDIKFLLELKWWDKGEAWIRENAECFNDIDILKRKIQK